MSMGLEDSAGRAVGEKGEKFSANEQNDRTDVVTNGQNGRAKRA